MNLTPLILASKSPRRKQILEDAGFEIKVYGKDTEESYPKDINLEDVPVYLAEKKARAFEEESRNNIIIAADTIVLVDNKILGKPGTQSEAYSMLGELSGKEHKVITGVCLYFDDYMSSFSDITQVYFRELNQEEIEYYVNKFNPLDKAGAYGIQEWIGMVGITKIVGSYYNVMGLPIEKVYKHLNNIINQRNK